MSHAERHFDWHQNNDEDPFGGNGSEAWRDALATLPLAELTRLANAIDAELEQAQTSSASRFVIEDADANPFERSPPAWLLRRDDQRAPAQSDETLDGTSEAFLEQYMPPPTFLPPALMRRPAPIPRAPMRPEASARKVYFAFDFDDLARVNEVRQSGKVGLRETIQRGFYDRAVWESRAAKNEAGLLALMRDAVKNSSTVCVLVGPDTWRSRWVKYEIARAAIEERGLLAVNLNGIEPSRGMPDRPGLNPLHVMGLYQHESGHCYLVERHEVVKDVDIGALGFEWRLYADHPEPILPPRYVCDIEPGRAAPLSLFTAEHGFMADDGATNIASWIDAAAAQVGR